LTDFGLARDSSEQTRSTTTGRPSALSTRYAAPEVASWDARSYSADIYSLGAVFLEMTTVLIGRSPKDLRSFMAIHGTRETPFWTNEVGFLEWTDLLNQTAEDESDTLPLTWIPGMMDNKRDHRPTARGLFTEISEPSVEVKYLFCGTCCADDDSTESVRSSGGSIEATVQDTGDETTVETRSDAKRPSPSESQTELTIDDEDELEPDSEPELADEKRPERMGPSPAFSQHDEGGSPQPPPARFDGPDGSETQEIEDDETQTVTPAPHRTADSDDIKKYRLGEIIPRDPNHPAATSEQYERHYHRYLELRTDPATNLQLAFNAYLIHLEQQLQWDRASSSQASIEIPPTIEIPPSILPEPRSASAEPEVKRSPALLSPDESARKHTRSASDSRRHAIMISAVQPWIPSVWPVEIDGEEIYPENRMVRTMRVNSPEDWTVSWPEDAYEKLAASPYISALDILILAIRRRHVSQIAWLLEKSPGSKMSDARGWSPLHYAAAYGDVEIMTMLVRAGFKFWADKDGTQPIHLAVQNGHLAAVRYLISLGANLDARDAHGVQAVRLAPNHMDVAFYDIRPEFELDGKVLSRDQLLANTRPNTDLKSLHLWNLDRNLILIHASRTGNINEVCSILAGEFDPHFVDAAGYSALHFAASFGHDQTCQLLLTAGFDSQLQSASGGFRPIHYANLYLDKLLLEQDSDGKRLSWQEECRMDGYRNTVKFLQQDKSHLSLLNTHAKGLLKAPPGTPVDIITNHAIQNFELEQDLRLAAGSGNTDQLLKCIQNGADVNGSDLLRETALHKAAASGYVEVVKILVAAGGNLEMIDIQGRSPLYKAVLNNHDAAVAYMCLQNAPMLTGSKKKEPAFQQNPQRNSEILSLAARVGNIAVVWQQLLKGADVNWKMPNSSTALHEAVLGQHEQIVRELIKVGANLRAPNDDGKLAINLAFESSQQGLCLLLQNAARDSTALESSVRKGDMSNTLQLLDNGVSARGFDTEGFTLLHHASILGYPGITAALIEKGAFVDTKVPEFGFTPLHYAIKKRHPAIVGLLVANGADIDARGPALQTPLMMAVLAENIPALTLLIEKGAELNAQDDSGSTALKHAMVARFPEGVKVLYDSGAASNDETITCEAIESYLEESFSKSTKPPSPSFPSFGLSADELATAITEEKPLDFPQLRSGAKGVMRSLEMFIRSRDRSAGKQS
jgi:ankyrin repeat protein/serine/threonine protein kinase